MKVIVVHDARGKIVSLARLEHEITQRDLAVGVGVKPGRGQSVLEVDISGDLAGKPLSEIHNEYQVDLKAKKLVKGKRRLS